MRFGKSVGAAVSVTFALVLFGFIKYNVSVSVDIDGRGCVFPTPFSVTIKNNTFRRLIGTSFQLRLWRNGKSTNLLNDVPFAGYYYSDRIVEPFTTEVVCIGDTYFTQSAPNLTSTINNNTRGEALLDEIMDGVSNISWYKRAKVGHEINIQIIKFHYY